MLEWPGNRPDLIPIENLWAIFKRQSGRWHPTSAKDLQMAIKRIWTQQITAEFCEHLVHSMPFCLQTVIKNKGEHTKY